ncbi:MAG: biosynthetic-type acetolactate synthase large subunit [Clostridia bacterium]|nr:biosynthetic-type acetolactate synthase large subunit [Clostridia bacterium]
MKLKGADILIQCLLEQGVDTIFGYPGGAVLDIYDALYKNSDKIHHILTAHEQGAAHAADGYARVTGKTGVCFATSGPGATNLVTGIATAYMDSVPLVAVTGNVGINFLGRDSFQEVDTTGITIPITKHNFIIKDVKDLAPAIRRAFHIANSGRKGPVLIDILKNVQTDMCEYTPYTPVLPAPNPVTEAQVAKAVAAINESSRPIIMAGGGCVSSGASALVLELARKISAPVSYTLMAKGVVPDEDPLCLGLIGMHGTVASAHTLMDADLIIALGSRFSDRVALNRDKFAEGKTVIHVDIDNAELDKNVTSDIHVMADINETLKTLVPLVEKNARKDWMKKVEGYRKTSGTLMDYSIRAAKILQAAKRIAPKDASLIADVGQHQMWAAQFYPLEEPRKFCTSGGLGTMGYSMGAGIGAAFGSGKMSVVVIGDGCFGMNMNELMTAATQGVPMVVLLINNGVLGMVRQWQKIFYENRFSQTTITREKADYVTIAEGMGAKGMRLGLGDDIETVLRAAFKYAKENSMPVLVDCEISPDDNVLPMIKPGMTYDTQMTSMDN